MRLFHALAAILAAATTPLVAQSSETFWVIAHRGASGHLPEHTLVANALAYGMGAHAILENPGVVIGATDLVKAFKLLENLDYCARIQIKAWMLVPAMDIGGQGRDSERPELDDGPITHTPDEEELKSRT